MVKLETNPTILNQRERVVHSVSKQSLTELLKRYREKRFRVKRVALVVGSQINPSDIANSHIRAHALEGRLFRTAVEQTLQDYEIRTEVLSSNETFTPAWPLG